MEVHHHGHVHEKKKWKEYLFQFFMLFLAVFCGSLAEYQLEHKIEKDREKQYIAGFINNIEDDTTALQFSIKHGDERSKGLDSLLLLVTKDVSSRENKKLVYSHIIRYLTTILVFTSNDATSSQLRNSGGYRLIQNKGVADSLTNYEQGIKALNLQGGYYKSYVDQLFDIRDEMIDLMVLKDTSYYKNATFSDKELPAVDADIKQWRSFKNKLFIMTGIFKRYNLYLKQVYEYAARLIPFLEKRYDLKTPK